MIECWDGSQRVDSTVGYEGDIIRHSLIWAGTRSGREVSHTLQHKFQDSVKLYCLLYWNLLLLVGSGVTVGNIHHGPLDSNLGDLSLLSSNLVFII